MYWEMAVPSTVDKALEKCARIVVAGAVLLVLSYIALTLSDLHVVEPRINKVLGIVGVVLMILSMVLVVVGIVLHVRLTLMLIPCCRDTSTP